MFQSVGEYVKAKECLECRLRSTKKLETNGEAKACKNLRAVLHQLVNNYDKARKHLEKSLATQKQIGNRSGEAMNLSNKFAMGMENKATGD